MYGDLKVNNDNTFFRIRPRHDVLAGVILTQYPDEPYLTENYDDGANGR